MDYVWERLNMTAMPDGSVKELTRWAHDLREIEEFRWADRDTLMALALVQGYYRGVKDASDS